MLGRISYDIHRAQYRNFCYSKAERVSVIGVTVVTLEVSVARKIAFLNQENRERVLGDVSLK